jgi:hypothetical protein
VPHFLSRAVLTTRRDLTFLYTRKQSVSFTLYGDQMLQVPPGHTLYSHTFRRMSDESVSSGNCTLLAAAHAAFAAGSSELMPNTTAPASSNLQRSRTAGRAAWARHPWMAATSETAAYCYVRATEIPNSPTFTLKMSRLTACMHPGRRTPPWCSQGFLPWGLRASNTYQNQASPFLNATCNLGMMPWLEG